MIKMIRTKAEYEMALEAIAALMDSEPTAGSSEADRLELLTVLVQDYEAKHSESALPTALDAIRFRMEQQGLSQRDLIPYIGSKSKVSEVLSGKRPLTLAMLRRLHAGLGIPAKVLLQDQQDLDLDDASTVDWDRYPLSEMFKRDWLTGVKSVAAARANAEAVIKAFWRPIGSPRAAAAMLRSTRSVRSGKSMDGYALEAWIARVLIRAKHSLVARSFSRSTITPEFLTDLVRLSWFREGPRLACEFLARNGIPVIIEPHLPGTYLDGAALLLDVGRPVIGLTIRADRLDNFWFSLMHELAHIQLHLTPDAEVQQFVDNIESESTDQRELEADNAAAESLVPEEVWKNSPASMGRAELAIKTLADDLRIHPAIVAGRIRHQYDDYTVLNDLVGRGQVRRLFPEVAWS